MIARLCRLWRTGRCSRILTQVSVITKSLSRHLGLLLSSSPGLSKNTSWAMTGTQTTETGAAAARAVNKHPRSPLKLYGQASQYHIFLPRLNFKLTFSLVECVLAKADHRPREEKKFYHQFSIVKYSYLPTDTFRKYVEMHVT